MQFNPDNTDNLNKIELLISGIKAFLKIVRFFDLQKQQNLSLEYYQGYMIRQLLNLLENINQLCYVYNVLHGTSF
jgi:hypothetical protein